MTEPLRHILFIIADQWRGDTLGTLGDTCVRTPHLEELAVSGTLFTKHSCEASPRGPARASILTGLYIHNHRQVTNWTPLEAHFTTLGLEVEKAGLEAALFGWKRGLHLFGHR